MDRKHADKLDSRWRGLWPCLIGLFLSSEEAECWNILKNSAENFPGE